MAITLQRGSGDTRGIDGDDELLAAPGFVALYRSEDPRVVRALVMGGLERAGAEDVAQEAFARTLGHWRRVRHGTNPPGYVFRVAFRLARKRFDEPVAEPQSSALGDAADDAVLRVDLERGLRGMPARRRACALLCLGAGLTPIEAGRALGIAPGTVRTQIGRARADLRQALDGEHEALL